MNFHATNKYFQGNIVRGIILPFLDNFRIRQTSVIPIKNFASWRDISWTNHHSLSL